MDRLRIPNLSLMSCDITLDLDSYSKHWTYYSPGGIDLLNTYIGTYATNADTGELGILLAEEWISYTDINNYVFSPDPQISDTLSNQLIYRHLKEYLH